MMLSWNGFSGKLRDFLSSTLLDCFKGKCKINDVALSCKTLRNIFKTILRAHWYVFAKNVKRKQYTLPGKSLYTSWAIYALHQKMVPKSFSEFTNNRTTCFLQGQLHAFWSVSQWAAPLLLLSNLKFCLGFDCLSVSSRLVWKLFHVVKIGFTQGFHRLKQSSISVNILCIRSPNIFMWFKSACKMV